MIDRQGKHKIHISCCAGFISKHADIFVVSLSLLDTETTKWITAMPDHLHPGYWVWTMKNLFGIGMEDKQVLVYNEKSINNKDARATATAPAAMVLALVFWRGIFWFQPIMAPCLARPSIPVILIIANIMGVDGLAMQVKLQPQGTTYPTYMYNEHIFVVGAFLMKHEDLIILHGQYHVCWWSDDPRSHAMWKREYSRTPRLISLLLMLLSFASPGH